MTGRIERCLERKNDNITVNRSSDFPNFVSFRNSDGGSESFPSLRLSTLHSRSNPYPVIACLGSRKTAAIISYHTMIYVFAFVLDQIILRSPQKQQTVLRHISDSPRSSLLAQAPPIRGSIYFRSVPAVTRRRPAPRTNKQTNIPTGKN